jgi:hypothetical protein
MSKASKQSSVASPRIVGLRGLVSRLGGARLCFGEPIRVGERTVIPVARVKAMGGGGFGAEGRGTGSGGGGGGTLDALPLGFIDAGPEGARFESIPDPDATVRALKGGAAAIATLATTFAGLRAVRARRRVGAGGPRGLLGR